jgi:hypothetical protein
MPMTFYGERMATALWHELRHIYPDLAPPKEKRDAERDKDDLFGPEEEKETANADQGTD